MYWEILDAVSPLMAALRDRYTVLILQIREGRLKKFREIFYDQVESSRGRISCQPSWLSRTYCFPCFT